MKQMTRLLVMTTALVCGAVAPILGADEIPDASQTYMLRFAPKTGDRTAYDMVMNGAMAISGVPGAPSNMDLLLTIGFVQQVTAVDTNGQYTTKCKLDKMSATVMGMEMNLLAQIPNASEGIEFSLVQDPTGKLVKTEGMEKMSGVGGMGGMPGMDGLQQMMNPITSISMAALPDHPLHLWEMWTPAPPEGLAKAFQPQQGEPLVRAWLCRIESVNGQECAKIRTRFIGATDTSKISEAAGQQAANVPGLGNAQMSLSVDSDMFSWLRLSDGKLMKSSGTNEIAMSMATPDNKPDDSAPAGAMQIPSNFAMKMHFAVSINPRAKK